MIVKATVSLGLVGCRIEFDVDVDDAELAGLDAEARRAVIAREVRDAMWEHIDFWWDDPTDGEEAST